jgi:hypothetical protein
MDIKERLVFIILCYLLWSSYLFLNKNILTQCPRNMFNYSQSRLANDLHVTNTQDEYTSTKIYNTFYFILNKIPLYKTKKCLDFNFNTLIQIWIKIFNLPKKKN